MSDNNKKSFGSKPENAENKAYKGVKKAGAKGEVVSGSSVGGHFKASADSAEKYAKTEGHSTKGFSNEGHTAKVVSAFDNKGAKKSEAGNKFGAEREKSPRADNPRFASPKDASPENGASPVGKNGASRENGTSPVFRAGGRDIPAKRTGPYSGGNPQKPRGSAAPIAPARSVAYRILCDVIINGGNSNESINANFNPALKKPEDRALASNIVYGSLKKKNRLEKVIASFSGKPLAQMDERVKIILSMSLYQIMYLDKIPPYAAVNDAVQMTKLYCSNGGAKNSLSGFVNALLRNALRKGEALREREKDTPSLLQYEYGLSPRLQKLLYEQYGPKTLAGIARAFERSPKTMIRVNTLKISAKALAERLASEGVIALPCFVPGCLIIEKGGNIFSGAAYKEGLFYAQDASGIISGYASGFKEGDNILDLCAAPGAKSFNAYILTRGRVKITACDISAAKTDIMRRAAAQYGFVIKVVRSDAR